MNCSNYSAPTSMETTEYPAPITQTAEMMSASTICITLGIAIYFAIPIVIMPSHSDCQMFTHLVKFLRLSFCMTHNSLHA